MVFLAAFASLAATLVGGAVAARVGDRRHLVLGLSAGLMLGVVGFDVLPEALEQANQPVFGVPAALLTTVGGFLTLHVVERAMALHRGGEEHFAEHSHALQSVGLAAGAALVFHSFLDGVGIGVGFQAGSAVGVAIAVAVVAHDFADGFNTFTITTLYRNARSRGFFLLGLDALAPVAGVLLGTLIHLPPVAVGLYLGYFAGALLYLATADILPEAHAGHESLATLGLTVAGAMAMWVVVGLSR
jgi:zinc transporter, ZIP family